MFTCRIENDRGQTITLTQDESNYQVYNIDGLNPPKATINTSTVAGMDGAKFNSSKKEMRNIVIYVRINGQVEQNRLIIYSALNTGGWCKFYYKNGSRDVYIEGYVETLEGTAYSKSEILQISIICPQPYFKAMQELVDEITRTLSLFTFPFAIDYDDPIEFSNYDALRTINVKNESTAPTGAIIEINFIRTTNKVQIINLTTSERFIIDYPFQKDDQLIIDTNSGKKSVKVIRELVEYNIFPYVDKISTFFQLKVGDNYLTYSIDDGTMDDSVEIKVKHYTLYQGV